MSDILHLQPYFLKMYVSRERMNNSRERMKTIRPTKHVGS